MLLPSLLQLFFAKVPRTASREQVQDVFARFGEVVSLNLFTPFEVCLLLSMLQWDSSSTLCTLHGRLACHHRLLQQSVRSRCCCCVPTHRRQHTCQSAQGLVQSACGSHHTCWRNHHRFLCLFRCLQNSPTSKGCGLVVLRSYTEAASAIAGLDNYKWEGMHSPMVVKLMPPQRQRQEQMVGALEGGEWPEQQLAGSVVCAGCSCWAVQGCACAAARAVRMHCQHFAAVLTGGDQVAAG